MTPNQNATSETAPAVDAERLIEMTATALIEEFSSSHLVPQPCVDQRNNQRIPYSDDVRVCPADSHGVPNGPSVMACGRDLSLWGISISSPQSYEVGTFLTMEFAPPTDSVGRVVTMLTEVRHVKNEDDQAIMGCRFLETLIP